MASTAEGTRLPPRVASTPTMPATLNPMTATNSTFGPGAAWASATEALSWASLSQDFCTTT